MSSTTTIAAIITTHNRRELLERALNSVLIQTRPVDQIVVVDDASEDGTDILLNEMQKREPRIISVRNSTNLGFAKSRNIATSHCTTELIAGLDDDDYWLPPRIETLLAAYVPGTSFVSASDIHMKPDGSQKAMVRGYAVTAEQLLYGNNAGNHGIMRRRDYFAVGGTDESLFALQDCDLWLGLVSAFGPAKTLPDILQVMDIDPRRERISSVGSRRFKGHMQFYRKWKPRMNRKQRKYRLLHNYVIRDKRPSMKRFIQLTTLHNQPWQVYMVLKMYLPFLATITKKIPHVRKLKKIFT